MKRYGHIVEQIATWENLNDSFDYEIRGKIKRTPHGRWLTNHHEEVIRQLQEEILSGTWEPGNLKHKTITGRGKTRNIDYISVRNGIALHAIMVVVERYIDRTFISDTAASIKGRGGLYLFRRLLDKRRQDPDGTAIVFKSDIRKCYESINQDMIMDDIHHTFKDKRLITILERCVRCLPKGMSIGLRSSQGLVNLFLSRHLDHIIKDRYGIRHYMRYCDDTVALFSTKEEARDYIELYHRLVRAMGLEVKPDERLFDIREENLDFLGYILTGNGKIMIRKRTKQRFSRRWHRIRSKRRKREILGSFYGISKHAHCRNLFKRLTHRTMKSFSELGFDYKREDGKKEFDVPKWSLSELVGKNIIIEDYEKDITTSQGSGRCLVLFNDNGRQGKFWTNKDKMKQALYFARETGNIPFSTTIQNDGKFGYIFT